jgi:hypothetical protein
MIKKTFTITPESGSNNGSISIKAETNTDINAVQEIIVVTGNGINKSINLLQEGYNRVYTDWAKQVESKWSLEGDFIFPDVFYGKGATTQPIKFPVDQAWVYNGEIAKPISPSVSNALIDLATNRQINRSVATNRTYNYKLNDNIIKTNGCWVFSVVLARNIANDDFIELYTGDSSTCELCVNDFQLKLAEGNPNISEFETYLQILGWTVEIVNNNQNNRIKFKRYNYECAYVPLFVKMMRQKSEPNVSDTCNLIIA